jgi:hypothetical protein
MPAQPALSQWTDPRWRLNNLYRITDETGRCIDFRLNWAQEKLLEDVHYLNVILKARQLGFTTLIQLLMLDACVFKSNVRAGTIAHTLGDAEEIFKDKVKFPYDQLIEGIRERNPAVEDSARNLSFKNNSSLRVGTSLRSGTFQYLHVSEYGKLCAKFPEKAREIKTGAFNTVHPGQYIFVESTAEGEEGEFHDMCETAQSMQRMGTELTALDFKFHFFPWWQHPGYRLAGQHVLTEAEDEEYFAKLKALGIGLTEGQRAWYVKKARQQGDDMKREFPSTPEEAFAASIEGAYYGSQITKAEEQGRVSAVPHEEGIGVETWWDLGMNDLMSIAWVQRVGLWIHFIDYFEDSGEGLGYYAKKLQEKQKERGLVYTRHVWPHDGNVRILDEVGRARTQVMADLGYQVTVVERGAVLAEGIEATRNMLPKCRFDVERCGPLVRALKNYRKEWDEDRGVFKNRPLHNWASHPADMVRTGAMYPVKAHIPDTRGRDRYAAKRPGRGSWMTQ